MKSWCWCKKFHWKSENKTTHKKIPLNHQNPFYENKTKNSSEDRESANKLSTERSRREYSQRQSTRNKSSSPVGWISITSPSADNTNLKRGGSRISRELERFPLFRQPGAKENNPEGEKVSSSSSRRHPSCERVQGLGYIDHGARGGGDARREEGGGGEAKRRKRRPRKKRESRQDARMCKGSRERYT